MLSLKHYVPHFFIFFFNSLKSHPSFSCFYFFQFWYFKIFSKNFIFFTNIFYKNIPFFILSPNYYFLQFFALPLFFFQKVNFKKKVWGWLLLYNLIKFKTLLWVKYTHMFLKKSRVHVIVSTFSRQHQPWLKYLRQKNFVLAGVENPKNPGTLYDFPFYINESFSEFYVFFVLTLFFNSKQKRLFNFFFFYVVIKRWLLNFSWKVVV